MINNKCICCTYQCCPYAHSRSICYIQSNQYILPIRKQLGKVLKNTSGKACI